MRLIRPARGGDDDHRETADYDHKPTLHGSKHKRQMVESAFWLRRFGERRDGSYARETRRP